MNCNMLGFCFSAFYQCSHFYGSLSPIQIKLDNVVYTIPPEGYLVDGLLGNKCTVAVQSTGSDSSSPFIFGDTFMRNFYITFDYKNQKMQLAVSANAPAGTTIEVTPDVWKIVWITVVVIVCLTIVGCLTAYCCRKYKEKKQARERGSSLTQKSRLLDRSGDVVYGDFEKDSVSVGEI